MTMDRTARLVRRRAQRRPARVEAEPRGGRPTPPCPCVRVPPEASAAQAGLRYVTDEGPGIRRRRAGKGFVYLTPAGAPVRDRAELARIAALRIPPAWTAVWICPAHDGHIQATGRDARGRKQYRYHARFREVRDETKYHRVLAFGAALPALRRRVDEDLARPGLPREKVLATVVRLLERTLIRVGNDEYARANASYGLTTMRDEHVQVTGEAVHFSFRGKSGREHTVDLRDRRLARIVKCCQDLPGEELFQYLDRDGQKHAIHSGDVNEYLRAATGQELTAKDFRTWAGTMLAAEELAALGQPPSATHAKRHILRAIDSVAARLGNTRTVCRRCYIHPVILDAYAAGILPGSPPPEPLPERYREVTPHEAAVMLLIEARLEVTPPSIEVQLRASLRVRRREPARAPTRAPAAPARRAAPATPRAAAAESTTRRGSRPATRAARPARGERRST